MVSKDNVEEYVLLMKKFLLKNAIENQLQAFKGKALFYKFKKLFKVKLTLINFLSLIIRWL